MSDMYIRISSRWIFDLIFYNICFFLHLSGIFTFRHWCWVTVYHSWSLFVRNSTEKTEVILSAIVHLHRNVKSCRFDKNCRIMKRWHLCYSDLVRSHDLWGVGHAVSLLAFIQHGFDLLSKTHWVFDIDRDLSLTRAVCVHREDGRTHHPVTCRLDTCQQKRGQTQWNAHQWVPKRAGNLSSVICDSGKCSTNHLLFNF